MGMDDYNKPNMRLLTKYAPSDVWKRAEKEAGRSIFKLFKTGAVITDGKSIVSKGCSHVRDIPLPRKNVHAEAHALSEAYDVRGMTCVIVTINKSGNWSYSSRPCQMCTYLMHKAGIEKAVYAERLDSGEWMVRVEKLADLIKYTDQDGLSASYAKQARLAA